MAVGSLLLVGAAVTKLLLRANDLADAADAIGDLQEGWGALRRLTGRPQQRDHLAARIAGQLEQRLTGVGNLDRRQDLRATALDVAGLIERLADDDDALLQATTHADLFHAYALDHGGTQLRANTSEAAEPFFDQLLTAALDEYATFAPNSPRYQPAALTRVLGQTELLPGIAERVEDVNAGIGRVEHQLGRLAPHEPIAWPLTPRRAPDRATGYQHRTTQTPIPSHGTVALSGATGHGKTQIAVDAYHSSTADLKLWTPAGTLEALQTAYADAATAIHLAPSDIGVEDRARAFIAWLANPGARTWLVVLDDLPGPDLLRSTDSGPSWWPPSTPAGLTLVTTQSRLPELHAAGRTRVDVDTYTPDEAVAYLHDRLDPVRHELGPDPLADAAELADDLAHHPLALAQAAAVIHHDATTTTRYRAQLEAETLEAALPKHAHADDYPRTVDATYILALDRAQQANPDAHHVLLRYALLDPAGAPDTLDPHQRPALRDLHHLSLLTHQPNLGPRAVRVHPLTARLTREHATTEQHETALTEDASSLLQIWPEIERDTDLATALRANAAALAAQDVADHSTPDSTARKHLIRVRYVRSLGEAGLLQHAVTAAEELSIACNARLGAEHLSTLVARSDLASLWNEAGQHVRALSEFSALLADCQRILGADDPDTFNVRSNLARCRGQAGDPAAAAAALEALLTDRLRVFGPDHQETFKTQANLAYWRGEAGDADGAVALLTEVVAARRRVLGADHPDTLKARHNLASWQEEIGDFPGAAAAFDALLTDRLRVLGPDHPETLTTRSNLASLRGEAGDPAGAAAAFEALLTDELRVLGPDHPHTLTTRGNVASWRGEAGDPAATAAAFEALLTDRLRVLGPDHPDTLATRSNLASWRGEAGDPAGAAAGLEALLTDHLRLLGPDHPHTLTTRNNLGYWQGQAGDRSGGTSAMIDT